MEPDRLSQSTASRIARLSAPAAISALCALISGGLLRFWMLHKFFEVNGDSQLYGSMAKNLLLHAQYALGNGAEINSTLIRLPGYPLFLAACFRLFGMENYFAPACIQIVAELAACVLLALMALRLSQRMAAAQATLWLACLCPFTAIYAAEPLTEAPTLFCIALALWAVARFQDRRDWLSAIAFTCAVSFAALLRPDGALVGIAFAAPIALALRPSTSRREALKGHCVSRADSATQEASGFSRGGMFSKSAIRKLLVCLILALTPFAAWTYRNYRVFHVIQPLAPRYANDPGEPTWPGWQTWTKTWCLDFVSTYQVYWNLPGSSLDIHQLPARAFDSPAQYAETARLFAAYEANGEELSAEIDDGFARIARQRITAHPLRYYVWLPLGRVADMLFRPRVENLPIDLDWWVYSHHWAETRFSWFYTALNALYFLLGLAGLCTRPRLWPWIVLYFVLRCALLATIEAPEARYTLEFFPMQFVLGGLAISSFFTKMKRPRSKISQAAN
jgi:hypothetical protein